MQVISPVNPVYVLPAVALILIAAWGCSPALIVLLALGVIAAAAEMLQL